MYLKYQTDKPVKYIFRSKNNARNSVNYIIVTIANTLHLSKVNKIEYNVFKEDQNYKGRLQYLTKNYPEFYSGINSMKFNNSDMQSLIYKLNSKSMDGKQNKLPLAINKDYLSVEIIGNYAPNFKDYTVSFLLVRYYMNLSTNTSFRIGMMGHYDETVRSFSEIRDV